MLLGRLLWLNHAGSKISCSHVRAAVAMLVRLLLLNHRDREGCKGSCSGVRQGAVVEPPR